MFAPYSLPEANDPALAHIHPGLRHLAVPIADVLLDPANVNTERRRSPAEAERRTASPDLLDGAEDVGDSAGNIATIAFKRTGQTTTFRPAGGWPGGSVVDGGCAQYSRFDAREEYVVVPI